MILPTFSTLGSGKTTVLLLHGAEGSHLSFAPQLETLASAGYRAVAWDMPGYGASAPIEPYTFKGLAQHAVALIEALRCGPVVLLGHAMGAALAVEIALRRPELISRVALVNPLLMHTPEMINIIASNKLAFTEDPNTSMELWAEKQLPAWVGTGHLPEGVRLAAHTFSQVPRATYTRALDALLSFNRHQALSAWPHMTLLLTGEQDKFATPASLRELASQMGSSADMVMLKGIGHFAHLEAPEDFDGALLRWLVMQPNSSADTHTGTPTLH